jgi:hypothetical protein
MLLLQPVPPSVFVRKEEGGRRRLCRDYTHKDWAGDYFTVISMAWLSEVESLAKRSLEPCC